MILLTKILVSKASDSLQIPLTPRIFPVWDFVVGIFTRKALPNMGRVLSTLSCKYLYKKITNNLIQYSM